MQVISVQSRVAYGYVGNAVAQPALQALGLDAWAVDTVRLAHHPGHAAKEGRPAGSRTPPDEVADILQGVLARTGTGPVGLLLGYLGNAETGARVVDVVAAYRKDGGDLKLIVDPVMGDDVEGLYVDKAIPDFYRDVAVPAADVLLPNRFEIGLLTGSKIDDTASAVAAAAQLRRRGPNIVMVSSVPSPDGRIANVAVGPTGAWSVAVERIPLKAKGTGDLLSALFAGRILLGETIPDALAAAVAAVDIAARRTEGRDELALPQVLAGLAHPAESGRISALSLPG